VNDGPSPIYLLNCTWKCCSHLLSPGLRYSR